MGYLPSPCGIYDCPSCDGRGTIDGPSPDQMHGAGDGFGGEDAPPAMSASRMLGKDLPRRQKPFMKVETEEWKEAKFYGNDYIGYRWIGHAFIIEDRCSHMLIGDQLPTTEQEAQLLCRVANIARRQAINFVNEALAKIRFTSDASSDT